MIAPSGATWNSSSPLRDHSKIVNRRNMWMIQRCQHFGLALKTGYAAGIATRLLGQYFDGNVTLQLGIPRPVQGPSRGTITCASRGPCPSNSAKRSVAARVCLQAWR